MTSSNRAPGAARATHALPTKLSQPAQRALANAGYTGLEQLTAVSEAEIAKLHGMGPSGIKLLRQALAEHGLSFTAAPGKRG
jgi:hypothetical protein